MPKDFNESDKIRALLWCDRHCCLCRKACGTDIEIAHIDPKGGNGLDNAIPLCYDCHGEVGKYNKEHPRGNKYRPAELKSRREQIYEEYTRHLVPPIHFLLTQNGANPPGTKCALPFVGFRLQHGGDSLPARIKVEAKTILNGKDLGLVEDKSGYYSGKTVWNINPRILFFGGFNIPSKHMVSISKGKDFKIEIRITVFDQYGRAHGLLPQCWTYVKTGNFWNLEPRSFARWS